MVLLLRKGRGKETGRVRERRDQAKGEEKEGEGQKGKRRRGKGRRGPSIKISGYATVFERGKLSICLTCLVGIKASVFTWQVTLCDSIWQVTLRSFEIRNLEVKLNSGAPIISFVAILI